MVGSGAGVMEGSPPLRAILLGCEGWFSQQHCSRDGAVVAMLCPGCIAPAALSMGWPRPGHPLWGGDGWQSPKPPHPCSPAASPCWCGCRGCQAPRAVSGHCAVLSAPRGAHTWAEIHRGGKGLHRMEWGKKDPWVTSPSRPPQGPLAPMCP